MKITNVEITQFCVDLMKPLHVAYGTDFTANNWIIKVSTDDGLYGLGCSSPDPFVTGETMETCYIVLQMFAKAFIGFNPLDIAGAHKLMDSLIFGNGSAKCAFDVALYDIIGKYNNLPVWKVLGGTNPVVLNDITICIDEPEAMVAEARNYVFEKGFKILKIKIGLDLVQDLKTLKMIRDAVGNEIRIRTDANQGYNIEKSLKALAEFEKIGIDAAEQLLPWWDFDGAAELKRRNHTNVKLMLDESIHDSYDAKRASKEKCADFFNIKLMKCGGIYDGTKIADIAEQAGVRCMVGCMDECKISLTAGISLVAAKKAVVEADCDSFMLFKGEDDGIRGGFDREGGLFTLLDKPGLGILEEDIPWN